MQSIDDIVAKVKAFDPTADTTLIKKAHSFAQNAHEGQKRKSGEPYVTHPIAVSGIIAELNLGVSSICAGLLHDTIEDTSATKEDLVETFGEEIAFLVDGVTKLGKLPFATKEERQAENFRKMLLAMAKDIRVILVKFCDRLDNMRTLQYMPEIKQERIANETMQIYAPLAARLGINWIRIELEDLSFRYMHPGEYGQLKKAVAEKKADREQYITDVESLIQREMNESGIACQVKGRAKHFWSIRNKIKNTGRAYEDIHDAIGFRVVTTEVHKCYEALGVAHSKWKPIPGRFKDYIALPKPNMYQSLHTAVIGPNGQRIEIQFRTEEMHAVAESGIAAHWQYKEGKSLRMVADQKKMAWLRRMMESQQELKDPTEFIESVKMDLFGDEVYVFTPNGDVKALPQGATPVDLAYSIHSEVGNHCSGARVNGVIVPLRYQMQNGDTVEIITSPTQKPNKDWLKLVRTSRAKTKIRYWLRHQERENAVTLGRDLLEKSLRKHGVSLAKWIKNKKMEGVATALKCHSVEDLLYQVGYGKITLKQVMLEVDPVTGKKKQSVDANPFSKILKRVTRKQSGTGIKVQGEDGVLVRYAKCCNPLPGEMVVGFITRGRGVTVHVRECGKALDLDPERRIDVEWDDRFIGQHQVTIRVISADKPGLLAYISQVFSDASVNLTQAQCRSTDDGRAINTFSANVKDLEQLKHVTRSLMKINGVYSVDRMASETVPA